MSDWADHVFSKQPGTFRASLEDRAEKADNQMSDLLSLLDRNGIDPDTALDVACGMGRHVFALAERGIDTHGVDISDSYIERARERAAELDVDGKTTFSVGDMRELATDDRYDLVMNAFTSFGYFDDDTNREVLSNLCSSVRSDGAVVLELANKDGILANFEEETVLDYGDHQYLEQRTYCPETSRVETLRRVFDTEYNLIDQVTFDVRLYSPVEMKQMFADAGCDRVSVYSSFDGDDVTRNSLRQVLVGTM